MAGSRWSVSGGLDWVEKSDVSALKEGVIKHIEFKVGRTVKANDEIGYLYDDMAKLTEAKAEAGRRRTRATSTKAKAQKALAKSPSSPRLHPDPGEEGQGGQRVALH